MAKISATISATDQFASRLRAALYARIGLKAVDLKISVSYADAPMLYRIVICDNDVSYTHLVTVIEFDTTQTTGLAEAVAKSAAAELYPHITKPTPTDYWYTDKGLVKIKAPDLYGIDFPGRKTAAAPAADDWHTYNDWQKIKASNLLKTAAINFPRSKTAPASKPEPEDDSKYPEWI